MPDRTPRKSLDLIDLYAFLEIEIAEKIDGIWITRPVFIDYYFLSFTIHLLGRIDLRKK